MKELELTALTPHSVYIVSPSVQVQSCSHMVGGSLNLSQMITHPFCNEQTQVSNCIGASSPPKPSHKSPCFA